MLGYPSSVEISFTHNQIGTTAWQRSSRNDKWRMIDLYHFDYMDTARAEKELLASFEKALPTVQFVHVAR